MNLRRLLLLAVLILIAAAGSAKAQTNVAVCDVDKVLSELDERRDGEAELKQEREHVQTELRRLRNSLYEGPSSIRRHDEMPPEQAWEELKKFEITSRVEEWRLNTKENQLIQRLDEKIATVCKRVAEENKFDLVLIEQTPSIPADLTTLTPEQLRAQLKQKRVIYKSDKVDITRAVITQLNADHAKSSKR